MADISEHVPIGEQNAMTAKAIGHDMGKPCKYALYEATLAGWIKRKLTDAGYVYWREFDATPKDHPGHC